MGLGNVTFVFISIEDKSLISPVMDEIKDWRVIIVKSLAKADTVITDHVKNDWFTAKKVKQVALLGISKVEFEKVKEKWSKWTNLIHLTFFEENE